MLELIMDFEKCSNIRTDNMNILRNGSNKRKIVILDSSDDSSDDFLDLLDSSANMLPYRNLQRSILTNKCINTMFISDPRIVNPREASTSSDVFNRSPIIIDSSDDERDKNQRVNENQIVTDQYGIVSQNNDETEEKSVNTSRYGTSTNGVYKCQFCEKLYKKSSGLYHHSHIKHADRNLHYCVLCYFFTENKRKMFSHNKSFHFLEETEKPRNASDKKTLSENKTGMTNCDICDKQMMLKSLPKHLKLMHKIKDFVCYDCGSKFKRKHLLKSHLEIIHMCNK